MAGARSFHRRRNGKRNAVKGPIEGSCESPAFAEAKETRLSDWTERTANRWKGQETGPDRKAKGLEGGKDPRKGGKDISHGY